MKKRILVLLFVLSFESGFSADFSQLQILLKENSKQLELKKYDIDIENLIQNMTFFAKDNGIDLTNRTQVQGNVELMDIVANAWHTA